MAKKVVCSAYITLRNGKRLYARDRGLKAFCFEVDDNKRKRADQLDLFE